MWEKVCEDIHRFLVKCFVGEQFRNNKICSVKSSLTLAPQR